MTNITNITVGRSLQRLSSYPLENYISYEYFMILAALTGMVGFEVGFRTTKRIMERMGYYEEFIHSNLLDDRNFSSLSEEEKEVRKGVNDIFVHAFWFVFLPLSLLSYLIRTSSYVEGF